MTTDSAATGRRRLAAYVGLFLVLAAMLGPLLRQPPGDSYPLSTYPMFAGARRATSAVVTVVGATAQGERVRLDPHLIGGTGEVMLAVKAASKALSAGDDATAALCRRVADRVFRAARHEVVTVEVITETYDAVDHVGSGAPPTSIAVHATCDVGER